MSGRKAQNRVNIGLRRALWELGVDDPKERVNRVLRYAVFESRESGLEGELGGALQQAMQEERAR